MRLELGPRAKALLFSFAMMCAGSCSGVDPQDRADDGRGLCCDCSCSTDGIPCLSATIERDQEGTCDEACEAACAEHPECSGLDDAAVCAAEPPEGGRHPNPTPQPCPHLGVDEEDCG